MKLQLSERDRVIAGIALRSVAWGGSEARMVALHELRETLGIEALAKRYGQTLLHQVPRSSSTFTLKPELIEVLISVLCGDGGGLKAEFGIHAAELAVRVRAQKPEKEERKP